ncbi:MULTISPECIES: hypothetical protein [unclassified Sphingomonas]|uniref:hypothetical protein n=1 Tax=unclassified Sphingomonas TaxID=196159 RepID=UPI0012E1ABA6|nr:MULTISPECIES: hypothetical protein [unclassified Sphingomonas]
MADYIAQAKQDGHMAALRSAVLSENPFAAKTPHAAAWLRGHAIGVAELACSCKLGCHKCDPEGWGDPSEDADAVLVEINRAAPYMDAAWQPAPGQRIKPSERIKCEYFVQSTNYHVGLTLARKRAITWVEEALHIARARYRRGYYANPFGDPVVRPC